MADVKLNALIDGLSGKIGKNVVMRQREGRTFLTSRAKGSGTVSKKQRTQRERFQKAVDFGKSAIQTPALKAEYEAIAKKQSFISPYTAAVTDYLTAPKIGKVDTTDYKGLAGNKVVVFGTSDYKFISVNIIIQQPDGTIVENGEATSTGIRLEWTYVATQNAPVLDGLKVIVTATDRPGNTITKEVFI